MITNPIKYQTNNAKPTLTGLPVIITDSSSEVYGQIYLSVPDTTDSSSASVYKVLPPTSNEHRYIRTGTDLYRPTLLTYSVSWAANPIIIGYRFEPRDATAVNGNFYSIEFNVNGIAPKIIIKVQDKLK